MISLYISCLEQILRKGSKNHKNMWTSSKHGPFILGEQPSCPGKDVIRWSTSHFGAHGIAYRKEHSNRPIIAGGIEASDPWGIWSTCRGLPLSGLLLKRNDNTLALVQAYMVSLTSCVTINLSGEIKSVLQHQMSLAYENP